MDIGYARTSTAEQEAGLAAQERDLKAAGCERIYSEQISATAAHRPKFAEVMAWLRDGDVLVATKPDRLARSVMDLLGIVDQLQRRQIGLRILSMDLDTRTPTGRLTLTILGGVAEFERALMLERQREGIAAAKAAGKYMGRKPTARARAPEVLALKAEGMGPSKISRALGISRSSVDRILAT